MNFDTPPFATKDWDANDFKCCHCSKTMDNNDLNYGTFEEPICRESYMKGYDLDNRVDWEEFEAIDKAGQEDTEWKKKEAKIIYMNEANKRER
jgi:hypothetical protein